MFLLPFLNLIIMRIFLEENRLFSLFAISLVLLLIGTIIVQKSKAIPSLIEVKNDKK